MEEEAHLSKLHDSLKGFAWGVYARLPWIYPNYRRLTLGVNETIDDSVWRRRESARGKNEAGGRYQPPSVADRP